MKNRNLYAPDRLKPLMPPPPLIHPDIETDRINMRRYARERYLAGIYIDTDFQP
jgi:hypothetical protein